MFGMGKRQAWHDNAGILYFLVLFTRMLLHVHEIYAENTLNLPFLYYINERGDFFVNEDIAQCRIFDSLNILFSLILLNVIVVPLIEFRIHHFLSLNPLESFVLGI